MQSVSESRKVFAGLSSETKPTQNVPAYSRFLEQDTSNEYEYDGDTWVQKVTGGAAHVYGLARNLVVQAAGTYNTTEVFGFICTTPGSGDWTIDPIGGSSVGGIDPATFTAGQVYPIHAESITVGTGGEAVLFIP